MNFFHAKLLQGVNLSFAKPLQSTNFLMVKKKATMYLLQIATVFIFFLCKMVTNYQSNTKCNSHCPCAKLLQNINPFHVTPYKLSILHAKLLPRINRFGQVFTIFP